MGNLILNKYGFVCFFIANIVTNLPINSQNEELKKKSSNESKKWTTIDEKPLCLMEGDIICPHNYKEKEVSYYMATLDKNRLWLTRIIPYFIDTTYSESEANLIKEAISDLEKVTCVKFKLLSAQPIDEDYIWIQPLKGCYSSIGRTTGKQDLSLTSDCFTKGKGTIIHEFIHSLGFYHEHTRPDRDTYIHVFFEHIINEFQSNFNKRSLNFVDLLDEPYDYYSIMHYGAYDFSTDPNSLPTLWPLDSKIDVKGLGQRNHVSDLDKTKLDKLYRCDVSHCSEGVSPVGGTMHGSDFNVGSILKFECNTGLTLVGSSERYCRFDGKWSGHEVLCIDKLYHYCNFEQTGHELCGWAETSDSMFKWVRRNGATPTENTGPIEDYTFETIRGHYIYMGTSAPQRRGDKAKIATPDLASTSAQFVCISFAYYMWGENLGTLSLFINEVSVGEKLIWEESGNHGPQWVEVKLIFEQKQKETFKLIFEGIVGAKGTSDIALDEVLILECNQNDSVKKGFKIVHS